MRPAKEGRRDTLLGVLQARFEQNMHRHRGIVWRDVLARIERTSDALRSVHAMEDTGGEPDVIAQDGGYFVLCDCSAQSPAGRRSWCYDAEALRSRKENKPRSSAVEEAAAMGIELLTEHQYRTLQELGDFDTKTSSWILTPSDVRSLGGALFCDRRYGKVFV